MASNKVTLSKVSHPRYNYRVRYPDGDKRPQKFFKKKSGEGGADEFAELKRKEVARLGIEEASITKDERMAVIKFRNSDCDVSLADAVDHYLKHLQTTTKAITCSEVSDQLLHRLEKERKTDRHIQSLKHRYERFNAEYGDWLARDVSTDVIDEFLDSLKLTPRTVINYRQALNELFNHAIRMKAASLNPVADAIRPKVTPSEPEIFTPQEVASLLHHADDSILAGVAIAFFAGLRASEVLALDWSEVYLEQGEIGVRLTIAKSSKRRLVKISDNLRKWIEPYAKRSGAVVTSNHDWRKWRTKARELAGIQSWSNNQARHSYASYHLAYHEDAGATALSLGHHNQSLLFNTYRALVSSRDADAYWSITPEQIDNVTDIKAS
jgi:integrase